MKKIVRNTFLWVAGITLFVVLLLGGATLVLNTKEAQQKSLQMATGQLSERLQTRVVADSVSAQPRYGARKAANFP